LKQRVGNGTLKKAFCQPIPQRWKDEGLSSLNSSKGSKSLKKRYEHMKLQIIKLRHLLLNDPENSHDYIFKFLKQFFSMEEIGNFEDSQLKVFITAVLDKGDSIIVDPRMSMRHFIAETLIGIT
jgi:hypothetical protein